MLPGQQRTESWTQNIIGKTWNKQTHHHTGDSHQRPDEELMRTQTTDRRWETAGWENTCMHFPLVDKPAAATWQYITANIALVLKCAVEDIWACFIFLTCETPTDEMKKCFRRCWVLRSSMKTNQIHKTDHLCTFRQMSLSSFLPLKITSY